MRPIEELISTAEPGIELVRQWTESAEVPCRVLNPSSTAGQTLLNLQVTTRSPLGAVAHDTGGILIQNGWLRFLGSGNPELTRRIDLWNQGRSDGYLLVADDAIGGFFALNGGAWGADVGQAYYWAPDDLEWNPLGLGYSELLSAMLTSRINEFYSDLRWPKWESDVSNLPADSSFNFYPFLWTEEGSLANSLRSTVPTSEALDSKLDIVRRLSRSGA